MNRIHIATTALTNSMHSAIRFGATKLAKLDNDRGMSTIEYAFGSLAAAALAGVLYMVVNGAPPSEGRFPPPSARILPWPELVPYLY